jgi:hypothetical protein
MRERGGERDNRKVEEVALDKGCKSLSISSWKRR